MYGGGKRDRDCTAYPSHRGELLLTRSDISPRTPRPRLEPTPARPRIRTAPATTSARPELRRRWRRGLRPAAAAAALPPIPDPAAAPPSQPPRPRFSQRPSQPGLVRRVAEPAAIRRTARVDFPALCGQPGRGGGRRLAREGFGGKRTGWRGRRSVGCIEPTC